MMIPRREMVEGVNYHCGEHDKIYSLSTPCPGCETEKSETGEKEEEHGEEEKDEQHRITFHHGTKRRR